MAKKPVTPLCHDCLYWEATPTLDAPANGLCHRFPPATESITWMVSTSAFVSTVSGDWCGEFTLKSAP